MLFKRYYGNGKDFTYATKFLNLLFVAELCSNVPLIFGFLGSYLFFRAFAVPCQLLDDIDTPSYTIAKDKHVLVALSETLGTQILEVAKIQVLLIEPSISQPRVGFHSHRYAIIKILARRL